METLKEGTYNIPEDLRVVVINPTTIKVQKRKARSPILKEGEYRCRDCIHWIKGHTYKSHPHYWAVVCEMKPKGDGGLFYAQHYYGKPCEHFQLKH